MRCLAGGPVWHTLPGAAPALLPAPAGLPALLKGLPAGACCACCSWCAPALKPRSTLQGGAGWGSVAAHVGCCRVVPAGQAAQGAMLLPWLPLTISHVPLVQPALTVEAGPAAAVLQILYALWREGEGRRKGELYWIPVPFVGVPAGSHSTLAHTRRAYEATRACGSVQAVCGGARSACL